MDKEREKLIGARLRAFRETLQIPRTKFAVTVGFGGERLASYESGRATLPYDVFRAIAKRYHLSARWLAGMDNSPQIEKEFDDADFIDKIKGRMLFTEVYDTYLIGRFAVENKTLLEEFNTEVAKLTAFFENLNYDDLPMSERRLIKRRLIEPLAKSFADIIQSEKFKRKTKEKLAFILAAPEYSDVKDLTKRPTTSNIADVKNLWSSLKRRLQSATAVKGKKSELAKFLKVDLTLVSRWMTEKKSAREPGAEYTLLMLLWVEQQERQK